MDILLQKSLEIIDLKSQIKTLTQRLDIAEQIIKTYEEMEKIREEK